MIFIYNETDLTGTLNLSDNIDNETVISLGLENKDGFERIPLATTTDPDIVDALYARFKGETSITLTSPMAKQFVRMPKMSFMYDVDKHILEKHVNNEKVHHRNMIVLVLYTKSKYFCKKYDKVGEERHQVVNVGDTSVKVIMFYTVFNNWNALKRRVSILIKSCIDFEHHAELELNYDRTTHPTKKGDIEIYTNRLSHTRYTGSFPDISKKSQQKPKTERADRQPNNKAGKLSVKTKPQNKNKQFKKKK